MSIIESRNSDLLGRQFRRRLGECDSQNAVGHRCFNFLVLISQSVHILNGDRINEELTLTP